MSRLIDTLTTQVDNISTNDWTFDIGTLSEQNVHADSTPSPLVYLIAPVRANEIMQDNGLILMTYNIQLRLMELNDVGIDTRDKIALQDRCLTAWHELFLRLKSATDSNGPIFKEINNVNVDQLFNQYDINFDGIGVTFSAKIYEGYNVCLT